MKRSEQPPQARPYHDAVRGVTKSVRAGIAVAVVAALGWVGGCSDNPIGPPPPLEDLIASDPVSTTTVASGAGSPASLTSGAGDEAAYVSLPPGTVPGGTRAVLRRGGDAATLTTTMLDGGFDPVPFGAQAGDSIEVTVKAADGSTIKTFGIVVAARRPPIVVRTDPPHRKTDVPLNASIVVVFSEPVAGGSLTSASVRLFRGTSAVPGTVRLLQGTGVAAAFTPAAPLDPNADYQLVVTPAVRDLDGDRLATGLTLDFTTGTALTGPPASVVTIPAEMRLVVGATYQLAATVWDAAGNMLVDEPVTWSSNTPSIVSVSPTGRITALGDGYGVIMASVGVGVLRNSVVVLVSANPAASVLVDPTPAMVRGGDTILLTAIVRDAAGRLINQPLPTWTSSDSSVANVAALGYAQAVVTGVNEGSATITASMGVATGTASVTVGPRVPVASVTVAPASATLVTPGATVRLTATLRDANGKVLPSRPITWTSDNAGVASVDTSGLVTAVTLGSAAVIATSDGVSDTAAISVARITFASLSSRWAHTCGLSLTPSGAAYCWGYGTFGVLGTGSTDDSPVPVPVNGGLPFSAVSPGGVHTCGLTTSGVAYCWGRGDLGALGSGSGNSSSTPVAVSGGLTFSAVSAGLEHTCGLTTAGTAYCWGDGQWGALGTGSYLISTVPVAVTGGLTFSDVSAGVDHTCGVTTSGAAYCWGPNDWGQLGNSSTTWSTVPVVVSGGLTFSAVSSGYRYTCGVTTSGAAYCWGSNDQGQLGTGSINSSSVPVAVSGGLTFSTVSTEWDHTCGVTTSGAAYCWGLGLQGQLGTGSTNSSSVPVAVTGGLTFSVVGASGGFTCGLTTSGAAYCWGWNGHGELGDGSKTQSLVPVKVAGQP